MAHKITLSHLPTRPPIDIEFNNLSSSVKEGFQRTKKTILRNVNGVFRSGELTAIMGPSGAGKSTLMNSLAGYKTSDSSGTVLINGVERNLRTFRKISCYIMQEDHLTTCLTPIEALNISAHLKLGKCNEKERRIIVEEVIETLGLIECAEVKTSNLSGGQRKRLSIALEMVNNPPVMFLDEPTSGLDSYTCFHVANLLKALARGGRTIICTIHQPSGNVFELFDNLFILAEGQCIYRGSVKDMVPFLSSVGLTCPNYHNPADYVMEVASNRPGDNVTKLALAVNNEIPKKRTERSLISEKDLQDCPASEFMQFLILFKKSFKAAMNNYIYTTLKLFTFIIIGFLLIVMYYDIGNEGGFTINNGCLFFVILMNILFGSMAPNVLIFPSDTQILLREHLNHWYTLRAYYFARSLADIPMQILFSTTFMLTVYYFTGQSLEPKRIIMIITMFILTILVAESYGLLIGALLDIKIGIIIAACTIAPLVSFCGFLKPVKEMSTVFVWIANVDFMRYIFEGVVIALYGMDRKKLDCSSEYCLFRYPKDFLDWLGIDGKFETFMFDVYALIGFMCVFRIATYLALKYRIRQYE